MYLVHSHRVAVSPFATQPNLERRIETALMFSLLVMTEENQLLAWREQVTVGAYVDTMHMLTSSVRYRNRSSG